jgi:hypothetical protein
MTSNSSSTTNFPWLFPTDNRLNSNSLISVLLQCTPLYPHSLVMLLPSNCLPYIVAARTTQHRKHRFPYRCRRVLPLSCLTKSLGADYIENTSSALRTRVYWSVSQHQAWRELYRKHFSYIVGYVFVAGVA